MGTIIEGGNCEEVHCNCVVSTSTHITHTTDKIEYANPKTTTTTNTSVQLSLTTSIIHTSNTGQAQQDYAQDGECEDGDESLDDQHQQAYVSEEVIPRQTTPNKISSQRDNFRLVKKRGIIPDGLVLKKIKKSYNSENVLLYLTMISLSVLSVT